MWKTFSEIKLFQVKPEKREQFEAIIETIRLITPFDISCGYSL